MRSPSADRPGAPSAPPRPAGHTRSTRPFGEAPGDASGEEHAAPGSPDPAARLEPGWRLADGYLAVSSLAVIELLVVAIARRSELTGAYELGLAAQGILPIALVAAAPAGVIAGLFAELTRASARPGPRALAAACAAAFGAAVGHGVSGGRMLDDGARGPFVVAVAAVAAALVWSVAPRLARWIRGPSRPGRRAAGAAVVALAIVAIELVNATVLARLYDAFHDGLAVLALLAAPLFLLVAWPPAPSQSRQRDRSKLVRAAAALVLFAVAAALSPSSAARLAPADNVRLIYATHAPLLSHVVELGAWMAPPPPLEDAGDAPPAPTSGGSVDLSGRDFLLVTIDALRADHAGAYGYERETTPNLDRLAAEGVVFEAAYTPTPHTSYAITSLMTGKYMRPLLLQGMSDDSETWSSHLRRYGYHTAAFYPPAVFFIDGERFATLRDRALDFEYRRVEFATAAQRELDLAKYLARTTPSQRLFVWVHLFEPHEPYESHAKYPFGDRDIDRYDAEIAAADEGLGNLVAAFRAARPGAVVMVAADHGEEFLEHGGRYHGTTVFDEQARVPLVVSAPGVLAPRRVSQPVQLVDLLPTVLASLDVPRPARIRGFDLGPYLAGAALDPERQRGFAFSETETQTLIARGSLRLVCERRIGACALHDVARDPGQLRDVSTEHPDELVAMRSELRALEASHGRYEMIGLRAEGKGWPEALRRGIAGDGDAAADVAALLDDADVSIRRKAAEVLFDLRRSETAPDLRLALTRDEDDEVKRLAALTLTRLGEGAPRVRELVVDPDPRWRRLAALALAESGDPGGERVLLAWWREAFPSDRDAPPKPIPFEREKEIAAALGRIRSKGAVVPLIDALDDVRLRPFVAAALAAIGHDAARPALAARLATERYQNARVAIVDALVQLGAGPELERPLVFLLGTPDPLPDGLRVAIDADFLERIGGPRKRELVRLRRFATSGVAVGMTVPKGGSGKGVRVLCRVKSNDGRPGELRVGKRARTGGAPPKRDGKSLVPAAAPAIDPAAALTLQVPASAQAREVFATLPGELGVAPGEHHELVFYGTQNVEVEACAAVPLSDELPPPAPEPWTPPPGGQNGDGGGEP